MKTNTKTIPAHDPVTAKARAVHWKNTATFENIPERMIPGLVGYVMNGRETGGFLEALLSNNLIKTFERADGENVKLIREYAMWLYNVAPAGSWGSPEKVAKWKEFGGLEGGA